MHFFLGGGVNFYLLGEMGGGEFFISLHTLMQNFHCILKICSRGSMPPDPLADECLDIDVQPPSPENTLHPSFDIKAISCNTSENLQFVKREKQFLVAVNCEMIYFLRIEISEGVIFLFTFICRGCKFQS